MPPQRRSKSMLRIGRHIAFAVLFLSNVLLIVACNDSSATTPVAPIPLATLTTFISSGIGATKADWERTHQFAKFRADYEYIYGNVEAPFSGYYVLFWQ